MAISSGNHLRTSRSFPACTMDLVPLLAQVLQSRPISRLQVTPREVNRFVAFAASDWIVGPTRCVVETALIDREGFITTRSEGGTSTRIV